MAPMDDSLVNRARSGDRDAMERVLASVAPSIRRFAARMCKNDADADDVLQDALLSIATSLDSFEGRSSLATWAFTLARTACSRKRRGLKNRPAEPDAVLETQPSDARGPDEHAESHQTRKLVLDALGSLPDDYREVLLLRDAEGFTAPEAAAVLGVSVDALKSRLHRARSALRDAIEAPRPTPTCPDVITALSRKLEDDLDPNACAEMERHVQGCVACARACDALKDALRACRTSPNESVPTSVQRRVKAAVTEWLETRQ